MGQLHTASAPPPSLSVAGDLTPAANAYFALTLAAAGPLGSPAGLARARAADLEFLGQFLDPGLSLALDLRLAVDPAARRPLSAALLGRVWDRGADAAGRRAAELRGRVRAAVPGHLTATPVEDGGAVARLLAPFRATSSDTAVITRRETIARPSRPDAGVSYYYSAAPLRPSEADWSDVYTALAASPVPAVLSVAVLPMPVPDQFSRTLLTLANFYARLAREGDAPGRTYQGSPYPGGSYPGGTRLAPDPFAVGAQQAFQDYHRRLAGKAFALRIQVSAARRLPPGLVETIAAAVSPAAPADTLFAPASPACDVRRPASAAERRLADYNLAMINFGQLSGRREIWGRPDPPDPQLAMLAVLGDARDASCAFRFPAAGSGSVTLTGSAGAVTGAARPGSESPVSAGPGAESPGSESPASESPASESPWGESPWGESPWGESPAAAGPELRLGRATGPALRLGVNGRTGRTVTVPLRSLTGPTLIAGAAGSGKTSVAAGLLSQLWTGHRVPFLVITPHSGAADGYRSLAAEAGLDALEVITAGDESGRPLRFNPFAVPAGAAIGEHVQTLHACFTTAFGLSGALAAACRDALSLTYLRAGLLDAERPAGPDRAWPGVADFQAAVDEVAGRQTADGPGAGLARRVGPLTRGRSGSVFLTSRTADLTGLRDHPVIVELGSLGPGDEQALVAALLLCSVAGAGAGYGGAGELAHVTLLDEAHRLLDRGPAGPDGSRARGAEQAAGALAGRLSGNGRDGGGLIYTTPFPARLVPEVVKDTGLRVMLRLVALDDLGYLGDAMGLEQAQRDAAARLRPGEALVRAEEPAEVVRVQFPAPAERTGASQPAPGPVSGSAGYPATVQETAVYTVAMETGTAEPDTVAVDTGTAEPDTVAVGAAPVRALPPFAGCGRCRARCAYRAAALSLIEDPRTVSAVTGAALAGAALAGAADGGALDRAAPDLAALAAALDAAIDPFAALPAAGPGRRDAAYCLFLHVHASGPLRSGPGWPGIAARALGLPDAPGPLD